MANISSLAALLGQAPYSPLPILVGLAVPASDVRLSDEVIDQLVVEIGADRVLCALDRLTQSLSARKADRPDRTADRCRTEPGDLVVDPAAGIRGDARRPDAAPIHRLRHHGVHHESASSEPEAQHDVRFHVREIFTTHARIAALPAVELPSCFSQTTRATRPLTPLRATLPSRSRSLFSTAPIPKPFAVRSAAMPTARRAVRWLRRSISS